MSKSNTNTGQTFSASVPNSSNSCTVLVLIFPTIIIVRSSKGENKHVPPMLKYQSYSRKEMCLTEQHGHSLWSVSLGHIHWKGAAVVEENILSF